MCKIRHLKSFLALCLRHERRDSASLQMLCVFSKKVSEVGYGEHGSLRVLHGCAGVTATIQKVSGATARLSASTRPAALTFSLPSLAWPAFSPQSWI